MCVTVLLCTKRLILCEYVMFSILQYSVISVLKYECTNALSLCMCLCMTDCPSYTHLFIFINTHAHTYTLTQTDIWTHTHKLLIIFEFNDWRLLFVLLCFILLLLVILIRIVFFVTIYEKFKLLIFVMIYFEDRYICTYEYMLSTNMYVKYCWKERLTKYMHGIMLMFIMIWLKFQERYHRHFYE